MGETRDRLEAIRKRAEEATPGPWESFSGGSVFAPLHRVSAGGAVLLHTDRPGAGYDAAFTASAREDIPWLLERVKELEGVVETIMGEHGFEPEPPSVEGSPDP